MVAGPLNRDITREEIADASYRIPPGGRKGEKIIVGR